MFYLPPSLQEGHLKQLLDGQQPSWCKQQAGKLKKQEQIGTVLGKEQDSNSRWYRYFAEHLSKGVPTVVPDRDFWRVA